MFGDEEKKVKTPSDLLNPEAQGHVNVAMSSAISEAVSASVAEAVKGIFASLAPVLKDMQLTPEKLNALKQPYVDPETVARNLREAKQTRAQDAENRKNLELKKASCPHKDQNMRESICLVHNYPDRQVRGVCVICHDMIEPRRWVIEAPDKTTGESKAHIEPAHKDYQRVLHLAAQQGS
jgi:hypothetical protein